MTKASACTWQDLAQAKSFLIRKGNKRKISMIIGVDEVDG
jgi:hypothetical protein